MSIKYVPPFQIYFSAHMKFPVQDLTTRLFLIMKYHHAERSIP